MDICGPMTIVSPGGSRYILTMIDNNSRYLHTVTYFIKKKSDAADIIEYYRLGRCPTVIQDQEAEYKSIRLGRVYRYRVNETASQYNAEYAPEQNSLTELRRGKTVRSWNGPTPFELWFVKKPEAQLRHIPLQKFTFVSYSDCCASSSKR